MSIASRGWTEPFQKSLTGCSEVNYFEAIFTYALDQLAIIGVFPHGKFGT
jgi:hypothetical protein